MDFCDTEGTASSQHVLTSRQTWCSC